MPSKIRKSYVDNLGSNWKIYGKRQNLLKNPELSYAK